MKIAFVVQRYGLEVNGGAELHCRWVAEHLTKYYDVSVITTCARDYTDWRNHFLHGAETINGVEVLRFEVASARDPDEFYRLSQKVLFEPHSEEDEIRWMGAQGPYSPALISFIEDNAESYQVFVFFTYLHYPTFHGLPRVQHKSLLVPTAHDEPAIRLGIFRRLFNQPRFILYNTTTERDFVHRIHGNRTVPHAVVGVGIDRPERIDVDALREKYDLDGPYILYVGRLDELKGCKELVEYFSRFREETGTREKLVLVGRREIDIPRDDAVVELGFLSEEEKSAAIQGATVVVIPSFYESLSMVALESWLAEKPILVNGRCHVLRDHCIRGNGGLYYASYPEFRLALKMLLADSSLRERLGGTGFAYARANYDWETIERRYREIIEHAVKTPGTAGNWRQPA